MRRGGGDGYKTLVFFSRWQSRLAEANRMHNWMLQLFDRPNAIIGRCISHKRLPQGHNGFYSLTLSFFSYKWKNQEIYLVVLLLIYGFSLQILHISDVEVRETSSHSFYVFIIFVRDIFLCNWHILWQNALYLYLGKSK